MRTNYFFRLLSIVLLVPFLGLSQVDVTFKLDMSGQSASTDGVHIAGSVNGWCTDCTTLTQEGTTDIYSVTVQLTQGWYQYKFLNGNVWGTEEASGYPCAPSNGNRYIYINDSGMPVSLETVPFNGCNPAGTGFEVTFNVDMSNETGVPSEGVHMAGWHTDWAPDILAFPDVNGDIHSATLRLPTPSDYPIEFQYKYLNGSGWGNEEVPGPEDSCATVTGTDRFVTVNNSGVNVYDVFNGCTYNLSTQSFDPSDVAFVYEKNNRNLNIVFQNSASELGQIQVFDMNGRIVRSIDDSNELNNPSINFQDMNNGIYIVRVVVGNKPIVKKVSIY
jgi:hypothetical protein